LPENGNSKFSGEIGFCPCFRYIVTNSTLVYCWSRLCKDFGLFYPQVLHLNILLWSDNLYPVSFSFFFSNPYLDVYKKALKK
jgi:hypothetical protein